MFPRNCLFSLLALLVFVTGCKKSDEYPIEPAITFKSLTTVKDALGYDDHAVLEISFTDGDGDIGLNKSDSFPPYTGHYYNNMYAIFYYDSNGVWARYSQWDHAGQIPVLTPEGNTKAIRGDVREDPIKFPRDSVNLRVRYEVFIYDRALHKSNTITTSEIIITTD